MSYCRICAESCRTVKQPFCFSQEAEVQDETAISDDELPPDVDLDDPFFSEELGGATGQSQLFLVLSSL